MLKVKNSNCLFKLGKDLRVELEEVLAQEESLWQQKSRSQWFLKGGNNTKLFHLSALIRCTNAPKLDNREQCD